jgi:translocation and assembly module TamB
MGTVVSALKGLGRVTGYVVTASLLLAIALLLIVGFAPAATVFAVDLVARLVSTPDRVITITEPSGLLTGYLRAGTITVSDTKGVFAEVRGLSLDWSPTALLSGRFHADRVAADSIRVTRGPVVTEPATPAPRADTPRSGGFSLPVAIEIDRIELPDVRLGQALVGREFALATSGSLRADSRSVDLIVNANRQDDRNAKLSADVAFAPAENRLRLKAQLAEPKGGMLATMMHLPGDPALNIDLGGEGPLSDWKGKLQASLDGQPRATLDGHHVLSADGVHHIEMKGGGEVDSLLPPAFRKLFAGRTTIDVAAAFDEKGKIDIQTGNLATGSVVLAASGTLDPAGNNSLNANLLGTSGPVDFRWPFSDGEARAMISRIDLAMTGAAQAVKIDAKASFDSASTPEGKLDNIALTVHSDAFDLAGRSGPLQMRLSIGESAFTNPDIDRVVRAPMTLVVPLQLAPDTIGFNGTSLESAGVGGTVNGKYTLSSQSLTGNFKLFALPDVLPEVAAAKFATTIAVEGQIASTLPGKINLSNLSLKSGTAEISGNIALEDLMLTADLSGRLIDLSKLLANADGQADFAVKAKGPLTAPGVDASLKAVNVKLAGRLLDSLELTLSGTADPKAPQANAKANGSIDGKPISISASVVSKDGRMEIPAVTVQVGTNKLEGKLDLSPAFEPTGKFTFDFPDIALLAALGGQKAEGDLKGAIDLSSGAGKIGLKLDASGSGIRRDTLSVVKPEVALTVDDLKAFSANGVVRAGEIASGANRVGNLDLTFKQSGNRTDFDLNAVYDNSPLLASGNVQNGNGLTAVSLDRFSAAPRAIPVKLAAPTVVNIRQGTVAINGLTIQTGSGSITVNGTAGDTLKIEARITSLPASLANAFAPDLDAVGTISGTVTVTGKPVAPVVGFQADWSNAATSQTKSAGVTTLTIRTNGQFADNRLTINLNLTGQGGLSLSGGGNVTVTGNKALLLKFDGSVPFSALSGQLAAQGLDMTGAARISLQIGGTTAAPSVTGNITTDGARLVDVRRNLALNGLAATVTLDGRQATISRFSATLATGGAIAATGTVGIIPASNFPADITVRLDNATYVDGTLVTATVSGTLNVRGPVLTAPVLSGTLNLARVSITVPDKLPASLTAINIQHRNAPPAVLAQLRNQRPQEPRDKSTSLGLDLQLNAPSQIFVRGRGIDAELGGSMTVRGTAAAPIVSGGFTMKRGRLSILSRRLDFSDRSKISFAGDLTPTLDMIATTSTGTTTVTVNVSGVATDPAITFSSSPALPQDEILAQLIFGQSMSRLSAVQIAQLADAAAQLAGGRSTSLFQGLRSHLGIDNLDITTDAKGRAQVGAGKYLNKRTYIELQQGGDNTSKAIVNFDVGRGIKLRGAAGSNGAAEAGIVYEHEY